MCEESESKQNTTEATRSTIAYCNAFLFVQAYAKEHGEKAPDYKHCANYEPKKENKKISKQGDGKEERK